MRFQSSAAITERVEEVEEDRSLFFLVNLVIISSGLKGCRPVALNPEEIFSGVNKVFQACQNSRKKSRLVIDKKPWH